MTVHSLLRAVARCRAPYIWTELELDVTLDDDIRPFTSVL
jgi:hypothetical protein